MALTEEDMKEFQDFSKEIVAIRVEMEKVVQKGFTKTTLPTMQDLIARMKDAIAKQKAFGRKHRLL